MTQMEKTPFDGRLLMLGCGSVGQCTLPLVRRHVDMPANRIAVMEHGRLVEIGEAESVCAHPREAYTRKLLASTPELPTGVA